MTSYFIQAFIYLLAAVIAVPLAKRLGLGGLQVVLTAMVGMAIAWWLGLVWQIALTIGLIFALSSTAIVLQTLDEKGLTKTEGGRNTFSVLLFQDIAVIPMLALIPLLALPSLMGGDDSASHAESGPGCGRGR